MGERRKATPSPPAASRLTPVAFRRTLIMGVLNVTPDSFSDGGAWVDPSAALRHARRMAREGADWIDVGGESTRPGALPVPLREELRRVLPVVEALAAEGFVVSIDTSKAAVARACLRAGASIVNDVSALRGDRRMARVCAEAGARVVLMHLRGRPRTMQRAPAYRDVTAEVGAFLCERTDFALRAGISRDKILWDPGIGFGKTAEHSLELLRHLDKLGRPGWPLLVGTSRKSFIGQTLGRRVGDRLFGTAASVAAAVLRGAAVIRVHDVREMSDVVRLCDLLKPGIEGR